EAERDANRLEASDGTTSEEDGNPLVQDRVLRRKIHHAKMAEEPGMKHVSVLERSSVGERTWAQYRKLYRGLVGYVDECKLNTDKVQDFDVAIVSFMTHMYMLGYDAGIGQKLIAAVVFFQPRFGKLGHLDMAIWTIIALCTYLRPGSMMQLTRGSLAPPTMKVDTLWRVLAHRSDLHQAPFHKSGPDTAGTDRSPIDAQIAIEAAKQSRTAAPSAVAPTNGFSNKGCADFHGTRWASLRALRCCVFQAGDGYPEYVEERVYEEVMSVVGHGPITWEALGKMKYCTQNVGPAEAAPHGMLQWAWVRYEGEPLWHQRLIFGRRVRTPLERVSEWMVLICAVDTDIYEEDYSCQGRDIIAVRFTSDRATFPAGAGAANSYRFRRNLTVVEMQQIDQTALDYCTAALVADHQRLLLPAPGGPFLVPLTFGPAGDVAAALAAPAAVPASALAAAPLAGGAAPGGAAAAELGAAAPAAAAAVWALVESTTAGKRGTAVTPPAGSDLRGAVGLMPQADGTRVAIRSISEPAQTYAGREAASDARLMSIVANPAVPGGRLLRQWRDAVASFTEESFVGHADSVEGEIIRTLNELYLGQPSPPVGHPQPITAGQQRALDNARNAVRRFDAPPEGLTGSGALEEPRVLSDYAGESATVAPLDFDNINSLSLSDEGFKPVPLDTLGGGAGRRIVERFHEMMLPQSEGRARIESEGPRKLYTDPALRDPKLHKSVKLRLILDGRHAPLHFQVPDKVALASGATFAGLHLDGGKPIAVAEVDLADAFYTMMLPPEFRKYFALPGCRAGLLGLEGTTDGRPLAGTDLVYPCFRCLPMGCSFSQWTCQTTLEGMALKGPQLPLANRFLDRRPVPQASEGVIHTEYFDEKFPIIGLNPALRWKLRLAFLELLVAFCSRDAGAAFDSTRTMVDSSRWGVGVTQKRLSAQVALELSKYNERWRFSPHQESEVSHRSHAFKSATSASPFIPESVISLDCSENPKAPIKEPLEAPIEEPVKESVVEGVHVEEERFNDIEEDEEVPEIPYDVWASGWIPVVSRRWSRSEHQVVLEARGMVVAARHVLRRISSFNRCHLCLGDCLGAILAATKGRPSRREMGRVRRQLTALSLASGAAFFWNWVPSERNSADRASRSLPGSWPDIGPPPGLEEEARWPPDWASLLDGSREFSEARGAGRRAAGPPRAGKPPAGETSPGSELAGTAVDYQARYQDFLTWAANAGLSVATVTDLEEALLQYLNQQYFDGHDSPDGPKVAAAVAHFRLDLAPKLANLPRVLRALKGWKILAPPRARLPLPWPVVALVADWMAANGFLAAARATALTFVLYLRPSETLSLRVKSVARPVRAGPRHLSKYSILLFPAELEARSKTKDYDISILLDNPDFSWVDQMLDRLVEGRAIDAPLFPLDMRSWVRAFQQAGVALGLDALGPPVLFQLRHGGASHEMLTNAREFGDIKKRGRWEADRSLKRYAKGGRVQEQLQPLRPVYLEIFSGSGNWSRALRRSLASRLAPRVFELDVDHEPVLGDLSRRRAQRTVRGWLRGGLLQGVWLGMPCSSRSRARNRPSGPPALRDAPHVLALPNLSSSDSLKVETGNRLSQFSFSLFLECARRGVPSAIENPSTSWRVNQS
ncbi:unnamed protein product, partial [Prorocentrum cordatum]